MFITALACSHVCPTVDQGFGRFCFRDLKRLSWTAVPVLVSQCRIFAGGNHAQPRGIKLEITVSILISFAISREKKQREAGFQYLGSEIERYLGVTPGYRGPPASICMRRQVSDKNDHTVVSSASTCLILGTMVQVYLDLHFLDHLWAPVNHQSATSQRSVNDSNMRLCSYMLWVHMCRYRRPLDDDHQQHQLRGHNNKKHTENCSRHEGSRDQGLCSCAPAAPVDLQVRRLILMCRRNGQAISGSRLSTAEAAGPPIECQSGSGALGSSSVVVDEK